MTITPTKPPVPYGWGLIIALVLLALGVPMLAGRLMLLSGDDTYEDLLAGRPLTVQQMASFQAGRLRASAWFPDAVVSNGLAMAQFVRATQSNRVADRAVLLKDSEYWQSRALSVSPADTYGWLRLSYLYQAIDGLSPRAARALEVSLLVAPYEPRLLAAQVQAMVKLDRLLPPNVKERLPSLIRAAYRADGEALVRAAMQDHFVALVEDALSGDAESLKQFRQDMLTLSAS